MTLNDIATYISGEDTSEIAKVKAELAYALSALDREIELCRQADARLAEANEVIEKIEKITINAVVKTIIRRYRASVGTSVKDNSNG